MIATTSGSTPAMSDSFAATSPEPVLALNTSTLSADSDAPARPSLGTDHGTAITHTIAAAMTPNANHRRINTTPNASAKMTITEIDAKEAHTSNPQNHSPSSPRAAPRAANAGIHTTTAQQAAHSATNHATSVTNRLLFRLPLALSKAQDYRPGARAYDPA